MPGSDLGSVTDPIKCVRPAAKTATFNGGVIDAREYRRVAFFQDVDAVAGTTPTLDGKIQTSAVPATDTVLQSSSGLTDAWIPLRNGAADNVELGMSWTTVGAVTIYQVRLKLRAIGTVPATTFVKLQIQGDTAGAPDGTAVATSDLVAADGITTGTGGEDVTFTFAVPADLSGATAYHLVLSGDYAASATDQVQLGVENTGSGGNLEIFDVSWADDATNNVEAQGFSLTFTDVSGATFTQVTDTAGENETPQEVLVDTKVSGPYLRYVGTIGGTTPSFTMAVMAIGGEKKALS